MRGVSMNLGQALHMRNLQVTDRERGLFELLAQLTTASKVGPTTWTQRFNWLRAHPDYCILVVEDTSKQRVVAAATLLLEFKFIRGCGRIGHIEDVVVDSTCRGKGLGQQLLAQLVEVGRSMSCYKVILDCAEDTVGFYESCLFERKGVCMARYF